MRPDVFAVVMATGIVSIAAADHDLVYISAGLALLAAAALVILTVSVPISWRSGPPDLSDPDVTIGLFTFVAACAVLDSRLMSIPAVLWTLSVLAALAWLPSSALTIRSFATRSWRDLQARARGAWELSSVGTSGLAIVGVALARHTGWRVLLVFSLVVWVVAIAVYFVMTALILARAFAARLDPNGFEPDAWILMGGLAIATLAGDHIDRGGIEGVRAVTLATWCLASMWILPLLYFAVRHILRPNARRFAGVWWSMVFPLGMYSAASQAMSGETGWPALRSTSTVFFWAAFAVWGVVAIAAVLRLSGMRIR